MAEEKKAAEKEAGKKTAGKKSGGGGDKLAIWQERLQQSDNAYEKEIANADQREKLFNGDSAIEPIVEGDDVTETKHLRNIIFENIETQVSSSIPMPKVTAKRKEDERLATIIEHMLRNEIDRLPFETLNDMAERTVPIQGGVAYLVEWDNTKRTHNTVGEISVKLLHPKQLAPQPGIYSKIDDMDWIIVKIPTTKATIRRQFDIDLADEGESEPEIRGPGAEQTEDSITEYIGYAKNDQGGIDRYTWANDTELEDLENYQARRQPVCNVCGHVKPLPGQLIYANVERSLGSGEPAPDPMQQRAGELLGEQIAAAPEGQVLQGLNYGKGQEPQEPEKYEGGPCPYCGANDWTTEEQEYEKVFLPIQTEGGVNIDGATPALDENGQPVLQPNLIPFYRPDQFPVILQKNVSKYGQLLGSSDVDVMQTQQNSINRMSQKILERLLQAGTAVTLPDNPKLAIDPKSKVWRVHGPEDLASIKAIDFDGDITSSMAYLHEAYEEARQMLGITDSFQGRKDATATSARAKEFSAAQAAGRMESKRVMKYAAYADIYQLMFKYQLAYSDEPRPITYKNAKGETEYENFNRYDFLSYDADNAPYWNDQFLFSCDASETLANNREAMWHEMLNFFSIGAFGDPHTPEALILLWTKMEELHYPGAGKTRKLLEDQAAEAAQGMVQGMAPDGNMPMGMPAEGAVQGEMLPQEQLL